MNKGLLFSCLILFILSACIPKADRAIAPTLTSLQPTVSPTYPRIPSEVTQRPSNTPRPSKTPVNTPSITSTLDVASLVTGTPSVPEECPAPANVPLPDLSRNINYFLPFSPREEEVLNYLDAGGNPSDLIMVVRQSWGRREIFKKNDAVRDLTGDGVPEILITPSELFIFGCQNDKYQILFTNQGEGPGSLNGIGKQLVGIQDMNMNGIPEIVIADFGCGGMGAGQCLGVNIYEWDGKQFSSIISSSELGWSLIGGRMNEYLPSVEIKDMDNNGTLELVLIGDIPNKWYQEYFDYYPWRDKSNMYTWDGHYFVLYKTEYSAPIYRYQAVEDGDRAILNNEYDKALGFYQEVIFNTDLLSWSPAKREHYISLFRFANDPGYQLIPTPTIPPDDPLEYPNLAAYTRYRIMLLHLIQGNFQEAQVVYETLQEKFPEGSSGHEFALIASAVWNEYQVSKDIKSACTSGISVANKHKEILQFLGSDYHNTWQDIMYEPKDICPFK